MQGGFEIFLVESCYRNRNDLLSSEPLGLYAALVTLNFTLFLMLQQKEEQHLYFVLNIKTNNMFLVYLYNWMTWCKTDQSNG